MIPPIAETTSGGYCDDGSCVAETVQLTRLTDGYDLQFGVNVLGHAALTLGLIPQLLEGAKTSPDGKARVINVSSNAAYRPPSGGIHFDTLEDGPQRMKLGTIKAYAQSKYVSAGIHMVEVYHSSRLSRPIGSFHASSPDVTQYRASFRTHCILVCLLSARRR